MFLVALLRFYFKRKALKVLNFRIALSQKEPLVATFSETCALTSRKYVFVLLKDALVVNYNEPVPTSTKCVAEKSTNILKSEKHKWLWSHSSAFAL